MQFRYFITRTRTGDGDQNIIFDLSNASLEHFVFTDGSKM